MGRYTLSSQAQQSLMNIKHYSTEKFGEAQSKIYLKQLKEGMQSAANKPLNGLKRHDIKVGYFSKPVGAHILFYKIYNTHIGIIDILHKRMDHIKHL